MQGQLVSRSGALRGGGKAGTEETVLLGFQWQQPGILRGGDGGQSVAARHSGQPHQCPATGRSRGRVLAQRHVDFALQGRARRLPIGIAALPGGGPKGHCRA